MIEYLSALRKLSLNTKLSLEAGKVADAVTLISCAGSICSEYDIEMDERFHGLRRIAYRRMSGEMLDRINSLSLPGELLLRSILVERRDRYMKAIGSGEIIDPARI